MSMTHKQNGILDITKKTFLLFSLSGVVFSASASGAVVVFGSDNDGIGGFTSDSTTPISPDPAWTTEADGMRFTNDGVANSGQVNSSLLKEYALDRTDGSSYTITGVLDLVSTYDADNNRFGISLFASTVDLAGIDSGLSLQFNLGNGEFLIRNGVNGSTVGSSAVYNGLNGANAIGTTFTFHADVAFVGTDIEIDFNLIDQNAFSQTVSATVVAADHEGTHFGFGTRGRVRGTDTRIDPFIYEAQSFSVIPEPSTTALFSGGVLGWAMFRRRQRSGKTTQKRGVAGNDVASGSKNS